MQLEVQSPCGEQGVRGCCRVSSPAEQQALPLWYPCQLCCPHRSVLLACFSLSCPCP